MSKINFVPDLIVMSIDFDNCLQNSAQNLDETYLDTTDFPMAIENTICMLLRRFPDANMTIMIGTYRQTVLLDAFHAIDNSNGSCFAAYQSCVDRFKARYPEVANRIALDNVLLEDIHRNQLPGTSFAKGLQLLEEDRVHLHAKFNLSREDEIYWHDTHKKGLAYIQTQYQANRSPDKKILYLLVDDRKEYVLDELHTHYSQHRDLLTKKMLVQLCWYVCGSNPANASTPIFYKKAIKGSGFVDRAYRDNVDRVALTILATSGLTPHEELSDVYYPIGSPERSSHRTVPSAHSMAPASRNSANNEVIQLLRYDFETNEDEDVIADHINQHAVVSQDSLRSLKDMLTMLQKKTEFKPTPDIIAFLSEHRLDLFRLVCVTPEIQDTSVLNLFNYLKNCPPQLESHHIVCLQATLLILAHEINRKFSSLGDVVLFEKILLLFLLAKTTWGQLCQINSEYKDISVFYANYLLYRQVIPCQDSKKNQPIAQFKLFVVNNYADLYMRHLRSFEIELTRENQVKHYLIEAIQKRISKEKKQEVIEIYKDLVQRILENSLLTLDCVNEIIRQWLCASSHDAILKENDKTHKSCLPSFLFKWKGHDDFIQELLNGSAQRFTVLMGEPSARQPLLACI